MSELLIFADSGKLYREAAERLIQAAERALAAPAGRFTLLLSGGSTPRRLYALLGTREYSRRLDWTRTHLFWGDERGVRVSDRQSNYRMVSETLLSRVSVPEENIHRIQGELPPDDAVRQYEHVLYEFFGGPPAVDLALLGMGADGHIASLFPGADELREAERLVVCTRLHTPRRITLTLPALNAAVEALFLVTGVSKAPAVAAVFEGPPDPDLPASLVRPSSGKSTWLVDAAAASALRNAGVPPANSNSNP